ncbi:MAG: FtsX-like permease family protein [Nocardioidaceae bacterium]
MLRVTLRNLLARKLRLLMSGFAIVLGVAFVAGSFIFTDALDASFTKIVDNTTGDVIVRQTGSDASSDVQPTADVPGSLIAKVRGLDGVADVQGDITLFGVFVVGKDGKAIGGNGPPALGVNLNDAQTDQGSPVLQVVEGKAPTGTGEIALDKRTADKAGYEIGDTVPLVTSSDPARLSAKLSGIVEFGSGGGLLGATLTVFDTSAMQQLFFHGHDAYTDLTVTTASGFSQRQVADEIGALLPKTLEASTGNDVANESLNAIGSALKFINTFLLVFAGVALVVGIFLIINTFSILVAQRSRELALLRALGASRRQVTRSVLLEAFVVGLIGSTLGLLGGFLLAIGLKALLGLFGLDLSGAGLQLHARTVIVSYLVGMVVTLLAAYIPALRASRIAPVAAMRDDVALPESSLRRRMVMGMALLVVGFVLLGLGLFTGVGKAILMVGIGILGVLVGVALVSPVAGRPVLLGLGALFGGMYKSVGRLASQNALRNPRRTAATASALMIGLALVTTMAILGSSTAASTDKLIKDTFKADFVVSTTVQTPFSPTIGREIAKTPGVDTAAMFRGQQIKVNGSTQFFGGIDPADFGKAVAVDIQSGSLSDLREGTMLMEAHQADSEDVQVGDQQTVAFPDGDERLTVVGTFNGSPVVPANYLVTTQTMAGGGIKPADSLIYITKDQSASATQVGSAIEQQIKDVPTVKLQDQTQYAQSQRDQINQVLALIYALLALAIVIAVLGIINTLALSVIERTREVGLLRAVGMSRRQLRRMVRLESIAISVLGAVLGVVMGVIFGVALQQAIASQGIEVLKIPVIQLVVFIALAAVVGVLAAVLPARRAAKLDVLRAITTE